VSSRLVVLGSCGAWPEAGRACSGFLIEHDGARVVLDLGYGTLPRLLMVGSATAAGITAVIVTHQHADHMVDLHRLFRARWFGHHDEPAIPLYSPEPVLTRIAEMEDGDVAAVRHVFRWHPLPAGPYVIGPFRLVSRALPHYVLNAGVRLSAPGLTVAYTGDTGPDPSLAELGRNADLYIVEASDRHQQPGTPPAPPGSPMHLTSRDAGEAATAAGARRLLLTHFWPGNDRQRSGIEAAEVFPGEVLLAQEGLELHLP
jgi:ribonuclease BN (tRNA processing enzyme)